MLTKNEKKSRNEKENKKVVNAGTISLIKRLEAAGFSDHYLSLWRYTTETKERIKPVKKPTEGKRFRTSKVFNRVYPEFENLIYDQLFLGNGKLFVRKDQKYLPISERKLGRILNCSSETARKCLIKAEEDGLINRCYLDSTHALAESMKVSLTEKGRKYFAARFKKNKKSTSKEIIINNSQDKDNLIYKSKRAENPQEVIFKNHDESIVAEAWRAYQRHTGDYKEIITPRKSSFIHVVLKRLAGFFHTTSKRALIDHFVSFLKAQMRFLRKPTFFNIFKLKNVHACINFMKIQVIQWEKDWEKKKQEYKQQAIEAIEALNNSEFMQRQRAYQEEEKRKQDKLLENINALEALKRKQETNTLSLENKKETYRRLMQESQTAGNKYNNPDVYSDSVSFDQYAAAVMKAKRAEADLITHDRESYSQVKKIGDVTIKLFGFLNNKIISNEN